MPLDLTRPVALSLIAVLHFLPDDAGPYALVGTLLDALAPGSCLVLSHITGDFAPDQIARAVSVYRASGIPAQARGRDEIVPFFDGLELLDPGLVVTDQWRPDTTRAAGFTDADASCYAAVARKPPIPAAASPTAQAPGASPRGAALAPPAGPHTADAPPVLPATARYEGYCVKCQEKRHYEGEIRISESGRRMAQGACPVCGSTISRIVGKA
jgi:hypothetical protein